MASWAEHCSRSPYNVGLECSETVFTKTTGNKGKKDRGVESLQAGRATEIQVARTANRSCQKLPQDAHKHFQASSEADKGRQGDRETGNCQLEKHGQGRRQKSTS